MNLILLFKDDFINNHQVALHGRRHKHVRDVLKATPGKSLQVGLLNDKIGRGTVVKISTDTTLLEIQLHQQPPPAHPVTVILAMPRPKVFKRILQGLTALGVKDIILLNTWRVDKSYWQSPALHPETLNEHCILGLEQSRDTVLPKVQLQQRFKPFVEDILPEIAKNSCALVAHPNATKACPTDVKQSVTLAIGPEGGFTDYELSMLETAGFTQINLGTRALRVETAVPALLGRLLPCHI